MVFSVRKLKLWSLLLSLFSIVVFLLRNFGNCLSPEPDLVTDVSFLVFCSWSNAICDELETVLFFRFFSLLFELTFLSFCVIVSFVHFASTLYHFGFLLALKRPMISSRPVDDYLLTRIVGLYAVAHLPDRCADLSPRRPRIKTGFRHVFQSIKLRKYEKMTRIGVHTLSQSWAWNMSYSHRLLGSWATHVSWNYWNNTVIYISLYSSTVLWSCPRMDEFCATYWSVRLCSHASRQSLPP